MYNIIVMATFIKKDTYTYISYMKHSHGKKAYLFFNKCTNLFSALYNNNLSLPQL